MSGTCDYTVDSEHGPVGCLAPAVMEVRWRWRPGFDASGLVTAGAMCEGHIFIACQELAEDPDVVYESIQMRRMPTI